MTLIDAITVVPFVNSGWAFAAFIVLLFYQNIQGILEDKWKMERTVIVWDEPHVITVRQKSKSVWIARGEYMGEFIETKGSSASSAASHWQEAARYKGN